MEFYDLAILIPATTAGAGALKQFFKNSDNRWTPAYAVVVGVIVTMLWGAMRELIDFTVVRDIAEATFIGIFPVGLGSIGLYSGVKNVVQAATKPEPPDYIQ